MGDLGAHVGEVAALGAEQLGHSNPELTLRVYAHVLRDEEGDISFADVGTDGAGTALCGAGSSDASSETAKAPTQDRAGPSESLERETGFEPATLSLGRDEEDEEDR
jgi:hypothetical protein